MDAGLASNIFLNISIIIFFVLGVEVGWELMKLTPNDSKPAFNNQCNHS
jgi:hypothetical protein